MQSLWMWFIHKGKTRYRSGFIRGLIDLLITCLPVHILFFFLNKLLQLTVAVRGGQLSWSFTSDKPAEKPCMGAERSKCPSSHRRPARRQGKEEQVQETSRSVSPSWNRKLLEMLKRRIHEIMTCRRTAERSVGENKGNVRLQLDLYLRMHGV